MLIMRQRVTEQITLVYRALSEGYAGATVAYGARMGIEEVRSDASVTVGIASYNSCVPFS